MDQPETESHDYTQPVAYDVDGQPLYRHPPVAPTPPVNRSTSMVGSKPEAYAGNNFDPRLRTQYANEPDLIHASRPLEPVVPDVSPALAKKHQQSVAQYPFLNLSEGEFVILSIRRHPIGLLIPVIMTMGVIIILAVLLALVPDFYASLPASSSDFSPVSFPPASTTVGILLLLIVLSAVIGGVAVWVYLKNQFYLTNEAVIQQIQHGLFSHHEQTVSLGSIEDASYRRSGIMQHLFNYGTMRLSTEGEETTYRFHFVEDPKTQVATVNDAVEAFKNGRPVGNEFLDS